jgi:hypothetical protein
VCCAALDSRVLGHSLGLHTASEAIGGMDVRMNADALTHVRRSLAFPNRGLVLIRPYALSHMM